MPSSDRDRRRRRVLDIRLLVGVGLVLVSVLGTVGLVATADSRAVVWAAASDLLPGDRVGSGDLVERRVALDGAEGLYLDGIPSDELIVTRAIPAGELVPRSSVGTDDGMRLTALVLDLPRRVSTAVASAALVDVWAAAAAGEGLFEPPAVLVADAIVVRVVEEQGLAAGTGVSVELLVPRERVARLLHAIANGDALAVVPAGMPLDSP